MVAAPATDKPYSYDLMGTDVLAVMDALSIGKAAIVGWSDGACTGLILGHHHPDRVAGVFFFACNVDPSGALPFEMTPLIERCFSRHKQDYAALSATPEKFDEFVEAVGLMQRTQPNYSAKDLGEITVPMTFVHSEGDEFIRREHAEYLARSVPGAEFVFLPEVTHFAPVQRPDLFNAAVLEFLGGCRAGSHLSDWYKPNGRHLERRRQELRGLNFDDRDEQLWISESPRGKHRSVNRCHEHLCLFLRPLSSRNNPCSAPAFKTVASHAERLWKWLRTPVATSSRQHRHLAGEHCADAERWRRIADACLPVVQIGLQLFDGAREMLRDILQACFCLFAGSDPPTLPSVRPWLENDGECSPS